MQLAVEGRPDLEERPGDTERLFRFLAHESAHLWNGEMFRHGGDDGAVWMHEGGAEAFAFRALAELGVISRARHLDMESEAVNACIDGLDGHPVNTSAERRAFRNYYTCGAAVGLLTEGALRGESPDLDLFDFWRALFEAAGQNDGVYTQALYLATLDAMAPASEAAEAIRSLALDPLPEADRFFLETFERIGIRAAAGPEGIAILDLPGSPR